MNLLAFGARNLLRNRRRTLVAILGIACGFSAVSLFAGYTMNMYLGLKNAAIYGELLGHLTVVKENPSGSSRLNMEKILLTPAEIEQIAASVKQMFPDAVIAERLSFNGLISNGTSSSIFIAESLTPQAMKALRGFHRMSGALDGSVSNGVTLSKDLAEMLELREKDEAAMLVSTLKGQANAADVQITDLFNTSNASTNDKFVFAPLQFAQSLLDIPGQADRLTLLLDKAIDSNAAKQRLDATFAAKNWALQVKTWQDLSVFYRQVKNMFDLIFAFLLGIVLIIVAMSVANTISMNVVERTREIGTLRAIGLRRAKLTFLFVVEAVLLVGIGCLVGLAFTLAISYGINQSDITYQPPNYTDKVPLSVGYDLAKMFFTGFALAMLAALAAFIPARRAASQSIVSSLIHT